MRRIGTGGAERGLAAPAVAVMALLAAPAGHAAEPARPGVEVAQADAVRVFAIPAQPLAQALIRFSRESGIELFFDAAIAQGANATPVSGQYTAREALIRLLDGTGITFRFTNATTVTLERLPPVRGGELLDPLVLDGRNRRAATAFGPVDGFVASNSAGGTKTDTPLIETPQSISVVTRDEMATRNARTIADALAYTSGVRAGTMGASNGFGGDSTSVRGFGGNGTAGPSSNEYIDGMRLGGTGYVSSAIDPFMFERVEVIKGPASVLYGQSVPGGLVNMVSKRPTDEPLHEIELQTGSYGRVQGSFDLSDRLDQDGKFLYRFSGLAYRTENETDVADDKQRIAIAPSLTWRPTTDTSITFLARYQKDDFGGSALNWVPASGSILPNAGGKISRHVFLGDTNYERWKRENINLGYLLEHRFNEVWTVRQNFRYARNNLDYAGVYMSNMQADGRTANRQAFGMIEHSDDYTLDNQVQARFATGAVQHTVLAGFDGQILNNDTDRVLDRTAPTIDIFNPTYGKTFNLQPYQKRETKGQQYGLYLQDQIKWDRLRLVFGLRQDWAESHTDDLMARTSSGQRDDAFTKRGALMYVFDNGLSPYVSYTESFDPVIGTFLGNGSLAKPTEGQQYEAGLKYQPPGFDSFITASVFDLRQQNVVTRDPLDPTKNVQTGEIASRGVELEGKASLAQGLNVTAAYTYLDAEVTKSTTLQGKVPTRIPTHSAAMWLDYTLSGGPLHGLGFGGGVRYVGTSYGNDNNVFKVPAFTLFDAAIRYDLEGLGSQLKGWQVKLNGTNLFDKEYVSACSGDNRCYFGSGRMVFASLKYQW